MKRIFILFLISTLFISCGDERGVDIGDTTVSVSLKEADDLPEDIVNTAEGMFIVFDSIARVMNYYDTGYSDEPIFIWRVITMMLNYCGESIVYDEVVHGTAELVLDYVGACFDNMASIPVLADNVGYNPESMVYAVPRLNDYGYDDYYVEVGDILDNGDGTFSAYINLINNSDATIGDKYIFTLKNKTKTNAESINDMKYSVTLATTLEF